MGNQFDPMEHRIRQAQIAIANNWDDTTVDQRLYALAGWFADRFGNGPKKNRARTIVVNLGFPAFGGAGFYAMVLQVLTVLNG